MLLPFLIYLTAWRTMKNWANIFVLNVRSNCSGLRSSIFLTGCCSPALFTSISMDPYASTTASTTFLQFSSYPKSSTGIFMGILASQAVYSFSFSRVSSASISSLGETYVNTTVAPSRAK
eukprot:Gb_34477 [translate_table: standard]